MLQRLGALEQTVAQLVRNSEYLMECGHPAFNLQSSTVMLDSHLEALRPQQRLYILGFREDGSHLRRLNQEPCCSLQALWLAGSLFFMRMGSFRHDAIRLASRP